MTTREMPSGELAYDDNVGDEIPQNVSPLRELGVTGVKRTSGYMDEEFLPALRGRKAVKVYREMQDNDAMVGAMLFAIDKLCRAVQWNVVPADQSEEQVKAQEFLESVMDDMSHSWDDFIGEALTSIPYGWAWHEIVFKKRLGPWEKDPAKRSKYTDGKIGIRKMPIRAQETLLRWVFDESGGVKAMVQMAPPYYQTVVIPIEKSLLFRTSISKGNPEGRSLLRNAYRSWYLKKRLEEFEAIGVERDLAGMPVAKVPADYLLAKPGTRQHDTVTAFRKMVRGVRRDENEGLVLPLAYDPDTKNPLYEFELMSSGGARAFDTNALIQRYEQRILMSVLADFILVGHESVGSYSLHTDKTGIFRAGLNAIMKSIADTLNRHLVPKLFAANGWKLDQLPKFEPTDIDPPDLAQLAQFITATAGAGMQWFPDPELEKFLRDIARLPEMTDETVDYKREMLMQQQAMEYAQSQMGLIGMQQKAEMTAQGFTPEQAEMHANTPNSQMMQDQASSEQDAEAARRLHPVGQADQQADMEMQQEQQTQQQMQMEAASKPDPNADINERNAQSQFQRERAKAQDEDKRADKAHRREKEKMSLQDKLDERAHSRAVQQLREKMRAESKRPNSMQRKDKPRDK